MRIAKSTKPKHRIKFFRSWIAPSNPIVAEMKKQNHADIAEEFIMLEKPIKEIGEFDIPISIKNKKSSFKLVVEKI